MTTPDHSPPAATVPRQRRRREFWRAQPVTPAAWLRVFRTAMACRVAVLLPENCPHLASARAALDEADRLETAWSVFKPESALSELNRRAADGPWPLDEELARLLLHCQALHVATEGAFDITATPLSRCWGLLARQGTIPSDAEVADARAVVGMAHLVLDRDGEHTTARFTRPGVELNLGAIGKGYAVAAIARRLRASDVAPALVSAGDSSVEAVGAPPGGWTIGLRGHGPDVALRLSAGATGTSGSGEQGFTAGGLRHAHVIDPRSGHPVTGVARVTVVTTEAATADALSTAFLVGGPDLARRYLAAHDETLVIFSLDGTTRPVIMGRARGAALEGV